MHSRAVLLVSLFAVACLIIVGSIALHLSTASAAMDGGVTNRNPVPTRSTQNATSAGAADLTSRRTATADSAVAAPAESMLSIAERATVDSLQALLFLVHSNFDEEESTVNNSMIPHLAQMITMINQHDRLAFRIEIAEPDPSLAQDRAQTLNNVLRLNVMEPSKLHIESRLGRPAALLEAFPV